MLEILITVVLIVCFYIHMKWQDSHPEKAQERRQKAALKIAMQDAENLANSHDGLNGFSRYKRELQEELKVHFFLSDSYNPTTIDISNLSGTPNINVTLAIIFYYIGNMPELIKENGLTYSDELKRELLNQLVEMELYTSYFSASAQYICITALDKYKSKRK